MVNTGCHTTKGKVKHAGINITVNPRIQANALPGRKFTFITDIDICSADNRKKCPYEEGKDLITSNTALKHYFNDSNITNYRSRTSDNKLLKWNNDNKKMSPDTSGNMMVCYQLEEEGYQPRSFEDDFFKLNADFIANSNIDEAALNSNALAKFRDNRNPYELAESVKSKAALAISLILAEEDDKEWKVPTYIKEGLLWMRS